MPWENASAVRLRRLFFEGFSVMDIAEPLVSFDAETPSEQIRILMEEKDFDLVGVRRNGLVQGYARREDLVSGLCGDHCQPFTVDDLVAETSTLLEVIRSLHINDRCFVTVLDHVGAIVTLSDLEKPPVRMFLFGMITMVEMLMTRIIRQRYPNDSWKDFLSEARVDKALTLQQERMRRGQVVDLVDCLQYSDKGWILTYNEEMRAEFQYESRKQARQASKEIETLRNNLAHTQEIIPSGWQRIVLFTSNLERILEAISRPLNIETSGD
jgi:hypothetical protein